MDIVAPPVIPPITPPIVPPPPTGPTVTPPAGKSPITLTCTTPSATFANLNLVVKVGGVQINNGPAVVAFSIADPSDNPVIGFGCTSKSATATVASIPNLSFALAKLVPGSDAKSPSQWVSYMVTTIPTTTTASAPTRPTTDNVGTLVDNKNGTYQYTFYRDVTKIKDQVAAMTVAAPANKADLGDLTYDATLVHRLSIQVSGNAPGTGTNTPTAVQTVPGVPLSAPVNVIYNFKPSTGAVTTTGRDMVDNDNCLTCHQVLGGSPILSSSVDSAGFHGGSRNTILYCVVCHTDQRKYGQTEATFNVTATERTFTSSTTKLYGYGIGAVRSFLHKVHLGETLAMRNYNYANVVFNETLYPQDIRNCNKCHDTSNAATPQAVNWKNVPSAAACGACHDGIDFATGRGVTLADAAAGIGSTTVYPGGLAHPAGPQPTDTACSVCHSATAIDTYHLPVTPPNPQNSLLVGGTNSNTNAASIASDPKRAPAGAIAVTYDIKSVTRSSAGKPVMVFRMLQNGARKDLNVFASATNNPVTGQKELWDGFAGGPSVYFVYSVPQDGIRTPSDFNANVSVYLRSLWNGTATGTSAGTLTGPDADGYYTATITGVTIPAANDATNPSSMLTGGLGYSYNTRSALPLTQTNLPAYPAAPSAVPVTGNTATGLLAGMPNITGGLIVVASNKQVVATGYTGRRTIVEDAKCNACHQDLGTFTEDAFHAGQRNDATTCSWCHRPNQTSSGWSADSVSFVHSIHAAAFLAPVKYNWHAVSATQGFWEVGYPGVLSNCRGCHVEGGYDMSTPAAITQAPNRLFRYTATGTFKSIDANAFSHSPWVAADPAYATPAGAVYGSGPAFNAATQLVTQGAATNLVTSPTTTVCLSCHIGAQAQSHFRLQGGAVYAARGAAATPFAGTVETCDLCHKPGGVAPIKESHNLK